MLSVPQSVAFLPSTSPSTASQTTVVGSSGNSLQPSILEVRNRLNQRFQSKLTLHNPTRGLFLFLVFLVRLVAGIARDICQVWFRCTSLWHMNSRSYTHPVGECSIVSKEFQATGVVKLCCSLPSYEEWSASSSCVHSFLPYFVSYHHHTHVMY
jgi:hypothetical protein